MGAQGMQWHMLPLEYWGCYSNACVSVIVSAMRVAVELGSTVTTEDADVPMD